MTDTPIDPKLGFGPTRKLSRIDDSRGFGAVQIPSFGSMGVYHFIGLGGIGMSAIARILLQKGQKVQGSDAKESALLKQLQVEGAKVHIGHSVEALSDATSVVYSTDIKEDNVELIDAKKTATARAAPLRASQ